MLRRLPTLLLMILGACLASQAPEFAQQYRQRLGGALDELRVVAKDFEHDARASDLSRDGALVRMRDSTEPFVRDRGASMDRTLRRYEHVAAHHAALEEAGPWLRPAVMLTNADRPVLAATWGDFEPAIPLTGPGMAWAGIGGLLFGASGAAVGSMGRRMRRGSAPRVRVT